MSKIMFFTDPHLGVSRVKHTTEKSRKALAENIFDVTMGLIADAKNMHDVDAIYCLGDLFDTTRNSEEVLMQGYEVAKGCNGVLAGNHDVSNRTDALGSLDALAQVGCNVIKNRDLAKPCALTQVRHNVDLTFVPHALTQDLFLQSLGMAFDSVASGDVSVLCLHCNVGVPGYAEERDTSTTLYLTSEWQTKLLERFDFILVGHEHVPNEKHGGRLITMGNVYPVSFGEIADRYMYILNTETKAIEKVLIYSAKMSFSTVTVEDLLDASGELSVGTEMVEIVGELKIGQYTEYARAMVKFWKTNEHIFAVRNNANQEKVEAAEVSEVAEGVVVHTLEELVEASVKGGPLEAAYKELVGATLIDNPTEQTK